MTIDEMDGASRFCESPPGYSTSVKSYLWSRKIDRLNECNTDTQSILRKSSREASYSSFIIYTNDITRTCLTSDNDRVCV